MGRMDRPSLNRASGRTSKNLKPAVGTSDPDSFLPLPSLSFSQAAAVVFSLAVLCFAVSYNGDFVFDDSRAILINNDILPTTPLSNVFFNDFWGQNLQTNTSHKSYRPLTVLTFRLSYYLGGGLSPVWFHVPNIILHGVVCVLLLRVISVLFGGYVINPTTSLVEFRAPKSSFLCAALFAVHPIHTESVSGVVGRADLLCAVLFLTSFYIYIKACAIDISSVDRSGVVYQPTSFSMELLLVSMALCCASVLCKEQGITVIGLCSAYDVIVVCRVDLLQLVGLKKPTSAGIHGNTPGESLPKDTPTKHWVKSLVKRHLILAVTGMLILLARWHIMGSAPPTFNSLENPHSHVNGTVLRAINYNYLYSLNAWLLLNPWWLCFDWSMGCVPVLESLTDPRIIAVVAVWSISLALIYTCIQGRITENQRILTMSLALMVVPFLPASNLFFRVGFVIAERILYLSSIGFCMLVVLGVRQIVWAMPQYSKVVRACLLFVVAVHVARSVQRSQQWKTELDLFTSGASVCPMNAKVHYNIANVHALAGNTDYAIVKYKQAIELHPQHSKAMNHIGDLMQRRGDLVEAEKYYEMAVAASEDFIDAWMNLGFMKVNLQKHAEAEQCYITALELQQGNCSGCFFNLGNLYLELGNHEAAIQAFKNSTTQDQTFATAWMNLVVVLNNMGRVEESISETLQALQHVSDEPELNFHLGNIYALQGKFEESEIYFLKTVDLAPNVAMYHGNLGVLYHHMGKLETSEQYFKKALAINPEDPKILDGLAKLHKNMKEVSSGN